MVNTVRGVLRMKGDGVVTVGPEDSVYSALETMAAKNIGAVVVVDGGAVVGIFSEREYARKVILKGHSSLDTPVCKIMNTDIYLVGPETKLDEAMALISNKRCRHLPVSDGSKLIGIVSIGDLVHAVIKNQGFKIDQLKEFVLRE